MSVSSTPEAVPLRHPVGADLLHDGVAIVPVVMPRGVLVAAPTLATLLCVVGCSGGSSQPTASAQAAYVSDVRTMETNVGGTHLTDQQLIAVARAICHGLDSGRSRDAELAYATARVGVPLATTVYTESVRVFCPTQERG